MKNAVVSEIFEQMADVMEILGEDPFRINSYRKVARVIGDTPIDIDVLLAAGQLAKMPGIGKSSLAKIEEFVKTGVITAHQDLLKKVPAGLLELLEIPGLGPKGVKTLYEQLKIRSTADLKSAIEAGSVAQLPGFGEKKAAVIARGIEFLRSSAGRIRLDQAMEAADAVVGLLGDLPDVKKILPAGSLRRRAETIGDVDILVAAGKRTRDPEQIIETFTKAPFVKEVLASGPTKGSTIIRTSDCAVQVDVRVVPLDSFGAAAQYFTGSKQHNVRLREIAVKAGMKLNEYGLFKGEKAVAGEVEQGIYAKLGLDYIEPLLREDRGEVEAAREHALPSLVKFEDIKGDFHIHTSWSDGMHNVREIAEVAKHLGYKFICITDHSQSSAIANGLTAERLGKQIEEIRAVNEKVKGIAILAGSEVDIMADGSLDFDNKLLAGLDFVIASVHSGMSSSREKVTMRTLKAMDNPYVNCIAHPTGRLLGQREPMDLDIAAVIKHAGQTHTALEINANPWRLDLKDVHVRLAIEAGVKLAIGTDAHSVEGLAAMGFGITTAGRGWATKGDILNAMPIGKIRQWVKAKRP